METWPRVSLVIFWLQLRWVSSDDKVMQSPPSLAVPEGEGATLNCSYKMASFQSLHWYKQGKKSPTFLFMLLASEKKSGRLTGRLDKKELLSTLHIAATQPGDSGIYLCAAEAQSCLVSFCLYPNAPEEAPAAV
ncbi:hypothetical protein MC885_020695, partial [Smutsia gigantea]